MDILESTIDIPMAILAFNPVLLGIEEARFWAEHIPDDVMAKIKAGKVLKVTISIEGA